jgi:SPP1 family phage portal protein
VIIEKVEVFDMNGIHRYILDGSTLIPDLSVDEQHSSYVTMTNGDGVQEGLNWQQIPLIPLKRNELEMPLLKNVKSLQDGINIMLSDFENNMQEDARNTILVLKNYDGTNLGEFRKNLATYGAVKVRYDGDTKGGVETLEISVNADNYKTIIEIFKKALIENAMGYDAKDDRLGGNANQMNIQSMYSDIDLDANDTETEYQAAFEHILWFVNAHFANTGKGNYENEQVNVIFNRDIMMNESEIIDNCNKSVGILSDETIIGQHPWVDDPELEMKRLEEQKKKAQEEMIAQYNPFQQQNQEGDNPDDNQGGDE